MSAKGVRCGICRRQSFMTHEKEDEGMCSDCSTAAAKLQPNGTAITGDTERFMLWAARRAWEFSDAITDATSFGYRSGDPGRSPPHARSRRRR